MEEVAQIKGSPQDCVLVSEVPFDILSSEFLEIVFSETLSEAFVR